MEKPDLVHWKEWLPIPVVLVVAQAVNWSLDLRDGLTELALGAIRFISTAKCEPACVSSAEITPLGSVLLLAGFFLLALAFGALATVYMRRRRLGSALEFALLQFYSREAREAYRYAVMKSGVKFSESDVKYRVRILKDFTSETVWERTIAAVDEPLEVMGWQTGGETPEGINPPLSQFSVDVLSGESRVLCIPSHHDESLKRFVLFFYPALRPGGPSIRLRHRSRWPKSARKLENQGKTNRTKLKIQDRVLSSVDSVEFSLRIEAVGNYSFDSEYRQDHFAAEPVWTCDGTSCSLRATGAKPGSTITLEVTREEAVQS